MIPDAIKQRVATTPFRPFILRMGSGDSFVVNHPELVSLSPGGRRLILWVGDERAIDIDLLLVESVQDHGSESDRRRTA